MEAIFLVILQYFFVTEENQESE